MTQSIVTKCDLCNTDCESYHWPVTVSVKDTWSVEFHICQQCVNARFPDLGIGGDKPALWGRQFFTELWARTFQRTGIR